MLKDVIDSGHAARFGALPLQSGRGRVLPVNTFSSEVLRKLHKSDSFYSLNSDQFLLSVLTMPERWTYIPFIAVPGKELSDFYQLPSDNAPIWMYLMRTGIINCRRSWKKHTVRCLLRGLVLIKT